MNMTRVSLVCAAMLIGMPLPSAVAQGPGGPPASATIPNSVGYTPFGPLDTRFRFRHDIGDGVGYDLGYTTFGIMQPVYLEPGFSAFLIEGRGIVGNGGEIAANAGVGFRMFLPEVDHIFGVWGWYDHNDSGNFKYDQFGASFEWLGSFWDFRANAYLPIGASRDERLIAQGLTGSVFFIGNNIGLGRMTETEQALKGGDFEFGGPVLALGDYGIRSYVGAYYMEASERQTTFGFKTRTEVLVTDDLSVQVGVTTDKLFGTNVTGAIALNLPDGRPSRWFSRQPTSERLLAPVERNYRVMVHREEEGDYILATSPLDGLPIEVAHVNNLGIGAGDGSIESPFTSLPPAVPASYDIIFVRRGSGATYTGSITLADNQRLLGEGIPHVVVSNEMTFLLPDNTPGAPPVLSNPAGDVVTLADNNEVAHFVIRDSAGFGITGAGVRDFNLHDLEFYNNAGGISLFDAHGTGTISSIIATGNTFNGINIDNSSIPDLTLTVDDVDLQQNGESGLRIAADDANVDVEIRNAVLNVNTTGFSLLASNNSIVNAVLEDSQLNSNTNRGLNLIADLSEVTLLAANNSYTFNADAGAHLQVQNLGVLNFLSDTEDFTGNATGLRVLNIGGEANIEVLNSQASFNTDFGFDIRTTAGGITTALFSGTTNLATATGSGMRVFGDAGTIDVLLEDFDVTQSGSHGIIFDLQNGSALSAVLRNADVSENNGNGIRLVSADSNVALTVDNLTINENQGAGISFNATGGGFGTIDFRNLEILQTTALGLQPGNAIEVNLLSGTFTLFDSNISDSVLGDLVDPLLANDGSGVDVSIIDRTTVSNLTLSDLLIAQTGSHGIAFRRGNDAIVDGVLIQNSRIDAAGRLAASNGLQIIAGGTANDLLNFAVERLEITNSTDNGMLLQVQSDAQLEVNAFDNVIDDSANDGIQMSEIAIAGDLREISGTFSKNTITDSGDDGVQITAQHDLIFGLNGVDPADLLSLGNLISGNGANGMFVNANGTAIVSNNRIINNGAVGIDYEADPAAIFHTLDNNLISGNEGDGIEVLAGGSIATGLLGRVELTMTRNIVELNDGRGIDILTRGSGTSVLRLGDGTVANENSVIDNGLEGIYVVNTSATSQVQDVPATDDLEDDGLINETPNTLLDIRRNNISGNGVRFGTFSANGLVVRVGTSNSGPQNGLNSPFLFGTFVGNGQVQARVVDNTFGGNLGDDVLFESFTSTDDPATSAGTWTGTPSPTVITTLERDPLARMNLVFRGNTGDSTDVTRGEINRNPLNNVTGAYYDNTEDVFKSRDLAQVPPGPFTSGDRRRNAQRGRLNIGIPFGTTFAYDGLGPSTFRVESDWDLAGFVAPDSFLDTVPFTPPVIFGELDFNWNTGIAPGTFLFN